MQRRPKRATWKRGRPPRSIGLAIRALSSARLCGGARDGLARLLDLTRSSLKPQRRLNGCKTTVSSRSMMRESQRFFGEREAFAEADELRAFGWSQLADPVTREPAERGPEPPRPSFTLSLPRCRRATLSSSWAVASRSASATPAARDCSSRFRSERYSAGASPNSAESPPLQCRPAGLRNRA
jgi:hypothetical protein